MVYRKYLERIQNKRQRIITFLNFIQLYLSIPEYIAITRNEAILNGENPSSVDEDILTLQSPTYQINSLGIYYKALIYSQLFGVKLNRRRSHQFYMLSELSKLKKYGNSFVCYHEKESK